MKNRFLAVGLGLFILSCNYDKASNGNIDQAYAKDDYAAIHGQHKKEMRERQKASSQDQKKEAQQVEVKDTTAATTPAATDSTHHEEAHH
ncbi:MAG TPA: hypothetical protein VF691_04620 [Cytophagaceae bacterium]|jgi:hypothetical protein